MKVMTPILHYGNNDVWHLHRTVDLWGMSLFSICSCPVHHNPHAIVVLVISGEQ